MPRKLGDITNPNLVSRFMNLAVATSLVIALALHPEGERILKGTLMAKIIGGGEDGKYRAYPEGDVSVVFSNASANFTLQEQADGFDKLKHFRVGDTIEGVDGTALGEILTFDAVTGIGTLTGFSANNYGAGGVRAVAAELSIADGNHRILKNEAVMEDLDQPESGYVEGFFTESRVIGATTASKLVLGSKSFDPDEIRLI